MLAEGVRFTGDGVYEKGSGLYDATVRTCGTGVCELVCVKVTNTDYLRGKSDMIVDCGSSSCEQGLLNSKIKCRSFKNRDARRTSDRTKYRKRRKPCCRRLQAVVTHL